MTLIHVLQCIVSCIVICTESAKKSIVPALIFYAGLYILVLQFFWPKCRIWEKNWRQKPAKRRNIKKFFITSSWLWLIIEQAIHFKLKKEKITQLFLIYQNCFNLCSAFIQNLYISYLPHFNITFYADMWLWLKIHFISQVWEAVVAEEGGGEEPEEGGGEGEAGDKPGVPQKVW